MDSSTKTNSVLIDYFVDLPAQALPQVHREQHGDFCHSAFSWWPQPHTWLCKNKHRRVKQRSQCSIKKTQYFLLKKASFRGSHIKIIRLNMTELLTGHLLDELDHRFAEWTPSQFQAAADWWLYLQRWFNLKSNFMLMVNVHNSHSCFSLWETA